MIQCPHQLRHLWPLVSTLWLLLADALRFLQLCLRPPTALAAENLFLRKQLALYQERQVTPRRATNMTRVALVWLARCFDWRQALTIVQSDTFIRWHRQGFRLFWRWKSRSGRPRIPRELQALIRQMACDNPTWGQERIANELLLKLGLRVSPRTVRKYMPKRLDHGRGYRVPSQRWRTFVRNHAQAIIACDFCVVVTATFRLLYVFVLMEHATRRILHVNVTAHPTAAWTLQQLREAIPSEHGYRFLLHDRDSIFSQQLDQSIRHLGLRVLKTPPQSPQANALCERLIGTLRRECLDFMIPVDRAPPAHVAPSMGAVLQYRPAAYEPGAGYSPAACLPPRSSAWAPTPTTDALRVVVRPILGGLHHAYELTAA